MTGPLIPESVLQNAMQRLVDEGRAEFVQVRGHRAIKLTPLGLALKGGAQVSVTVQRESGEEVGHG